jgi:hypothetical protein
MNHVSRPFPRGPLPWTRWIRILGSVLVLAAAFAGAFPGAVFGYEHRKSTPSFGALIGYGRLVQGETFFVPRYPIGEGVTAQRSFKTSDVFTQWGASAHVGIRFVLERNQALGFGFDDLRYRRKDGYNELERQALPRWIKFTTFHADYYVYFQRRHRVSLYVAPLLGIQQRELRYKGSEVQTQEYRLLYGSSLGVEYFVRRTFSLELSGRLYGLRGGDGTNVVLQPALGFHVYVI